MSIPEGLSILARIELSARTKHSMSAGRRLFLDTRSPILVRT